MKFSLRLTIFLLVLAGFLPAFYSPLSAQENPGTGRNHPVADCAITGKVAASGSKQPLSFATVTLLTLADSNLVTGTLTDENGMFRIEHLPPGNYRIRIKYIGYETGRRNLMLEQGLSDLGLVLLKESGKQLSEIVISEEKSGSQVGIEKKVFNVENDLNSRGGSAVDVMRSIPAVSVDVDGNVNLRGSGNITILIDGRPSGMVGAARTSLFEQIPSSSIERIELITNPSVKYDPDGVSGIINIVLKKNKLQGWNVNTMLSYGTFNKTNVSLNLGYRNRKMNVYAVLNYRSSQKWYSGYTNRKNTLTDTAFSINQSSSGIRNIQTQMLKAGIDYTLNSKNAISFSCLLNKDLDSDQDHVGYMYLDRNDILSESSKREMNGMASYKGQEGDLSYTRSFDRAEKIFSAEISASANKNNAVDSISQQNFLPNQTPIGYYPSFQKTENKGSLQMFKAKADLTQPIGDAVQLNAGLKASFRVLDGNFSSDTLRQPAKEWVRDTSVNNHFGYEEQIYGAYASWNQKVQRFSYELGGRVEDSRVLITLGHPNISFTRHNTDFFPYAHISLKKSETEEIRFGYSRRINRPPFRFLNPFADYTDPLNLHYGNPYLKSEYANAFELAYTKYFKKTSFNANLYFRRVENAIQVFKTLSDSLTGASVSTYANLHRDDILGVEVITKMDLLTWLNLTWNLNAYEITLNSDDPNYSSRIHSFNVIAKMTSRMSLRKGFLILISGSYSNGEKTMQGMVHEQYYLDMSVRKDFMKQKLGISLGLSDVFNSFNNQSEIITSQISQQYLKKRESRFATVTISYNFGQMGEASRKHKTQEETPVPALPEQE